MKIAVLSGKGGTGKTFISVNLATVSKKSTYIDCDVEEPNGHLFFKPTNIETEDVTVNIPFLNNSLCNNCRKCVEFCKFNALAYADNKLIIFDDICHSCGGCVLFCPQNALIEKPKIIGKIQKGISENVDVFTGILNPGQPSGVPIIEKLLTDISIYDDLTVIDCPPGAACTVMESIKDADYCVLVTEPTIFGVHNLNMVYNLVTLFKKPFGVILNKYLDAENPTEKFCIENNIKILDRIPFDSELGVLNSNGLIASKKSQKYENLFFSLLKTITKEVQDETIANS